MALTSRANIYSVDTSAFFTHQELRIEHERNILISERNTLKKEIKILEKFHNCSISEKTAIREYKKLFPFKIVESLPAISEVREKKERISTISPVIKELKDRLFEEFNAHIGVRALNQEKLGRDSVVSVFASDLTRTLGIETSDTCNLLTPVNEDIVIIRVYYMSVLLDLIVDGFLWDGERYVCYTASAGQIRTKKIVFIRESALLKHQNTIMCGLTLDKINSKGGVNANKYLSYLALTNSATDLWERFNIDKSIVVDDLETQVNGLVDFIDRETFEIQRKTMDIDIAHTDGCGMVLPRLNSNNFMVRLPWVKGLLSPFPFHKFVRERSASTGEYCGIVKDIYGVEHDIIKEDIEVIFTKSQFKMHKYYDSWEEYKDNFKKYGCSAGMCNEEDLYFSDAKINYQMLQTLVDMSDEELSDICSETNKTLSDITSDRDTMLRLFGATANNKNKNPFQEALYLYPELLQDEYSRSSLRDIKDSVEKEAWAGKVEIQGKYLFMIPDLYAFCEFLFLKHQKPAGLLKNQEVFSSIYKEKPKLDCLRSPHLYREHAIRENAYDAEKARWFVTRGLYTSSHDLISKLLQCDWDGDKSLVCCDETLLSVAERNMRDIVPLYYDMAKASSQIINPHVLYNGLKKAYTSGNIGFYSNNISKEWSSDSPKLDTIKHLCMLNNFAIDVAKTLYMPETPKHIADEIKSVTKKRLPYFFVYAKDKLDDQVADVNESCINKISNIVPKRRLLFGRDNIGKFDYRFLMCSSDVSLDYAIPKRIIERYVELTKNINIRMVKVDSKHNNYNYVFQEVRDEMFKVLADENYVCDVLVKYLFRVKRTPRKMAFWSCFGDIVVRNLKENISERSKQCKVCGSRFLKVYNREELCESCRKKTVGDTKVINCEDCGKKVIISSRASKTKLCAGCQKERNKTRKREWKSKKSRRSIEI